MEYVQGETLASVLYRLGPSPELASDVILRACSAVRELHEGFNPPIIHRDLKPGNIILSQERLALIDFGIARVYNENSETDTIRFGTRRYAPPEQFGFGQTDVRSDAYSLGMLLFYCLTARTANSKDRKRNFSDANVPEEFRKVVRKACAFDPEARYRTVAELQQAVSSANAAYVRGRKGKLESRES
jgi:eukaryotic-like serine/threonine-protein kinase